MAAYVSKVVFNEAARDHEVSKILQDGKHCIVFRDKVQPFFGIVACTQPEIRKVFQAYCNNNPRANPRECEMIRRQYLRNPSALRWMTVVHDGILYGNADVDVVNQTPPPASD